MVGDARGVITVTVTAPTLPKGAVAVIEVGLLYVKLVAGVAPKLTAVTPSKLVPVIVVTVAPPTGPMFGAMLLIVATPYGVATTVGLSTTGDPTPVLVVRNTTEYDVPLVRDEITNDPEAVSAVET